MRMASCGVRKLLISGLVIGVIVSGLTAGCARAVSADEITVTYPYYGFVENPDNPWESVYDALDETGEVQYSDAFFAEPSPGEHAKLRAASYALALAGFENQKDGYPASPSNPNPKLYGMLTQMGFSDFESWDIESEDNGHSMGTTIGHKTLNTGQELIVVAPRNYNYLTEWLSNFNVGVSGDHAGFSESADLMIDRFNQYVSTHNYENYKVWVVGYSRGGAVVDLFAKNINEHITNYGLSPDDFYVYTFGAPRASVVETKYANIHDVKDGNDLLLGYLFPEAWGFYNTGVYEEIHPADLAITTGMVDITDLVNSKSVMDLMNIGDLTKEVGEMNGREFMDEWLQFVTVSGLTREYFDTEVKPPLSALMQLYQARELDRQSDFIEFFKSIDGGLAGILLKNIMEDLSNYSGDLNKYPFYQDILKVLKGTATEADVNELTDCLGGYINEADYEKLPDRPIKVSPEEFAVIKENLPKLVKALAPILIADAKYTRATYGENYSLYYTYSLVSNAENLVVGHIPESIMPILKSLIVDDNNGEESVLRVPNTGQEGANRENGSLAVAVDYSAMIIMTLVTAGIIWYRRRV